MNILERENAISTFYNILDIGGERSLASQKVKVDVNQYWESLRVMPILSYIPGEVIVKLHQIMLSGRLMNKPAEKFKMMNDLLAPFRFKPLASGTNRRTFYCEYDSRVILKVATDTVGRTANIREYNVQSIVKPFCPKIFELGYDGVLILSERVEKMTEEQYRKIYASDIFDVIVNLLKKGFIVEDIGSNFFKNFGVRMGFGPVIVDFGDIYKVDYRKLKCHRIIDLEGNICGGAIDYDYTKGMSEIVCTKCGTRYSAKYLEDLDPSRKKIVQGGSYIMRRINSNLKVSVVENGKYISGYMANEPDFKVQQRRIQAQAIQRQRPEDSVDVQQFVQEKQNVVTESVANAQPQTSREAYDMLNNVSSNPFNSNRRAPKISASVYTPMPPAPPILPIPPTPNTNPQYQVITDPNKDLTSSQKMTAITDEQAAQILATKKAPSMHSSTKIPVWSNYEGKNGVTYLMYPKEVKNKIIYFLKGVEKDFGFSVAEFLASKLEIYYIKNDKFSGHENINMVKPTHEAKSHQTIKARVVVPPQTPVADPPKAQEPAAKAPEQKPYPVPTPIPECMMPKENVQKVEDIQKTEEVNKPLESVINGNVTSNWLGMNPSEAIKNTDVVTQDSTVINEMKKEIEIPAANHNIVVEKETPNDTTIEKEEQKPTNPNLIIPPERPDWMPKDGLYPMEPKGQESVKMVEGNAVMGFPGEPLIDTLREEQELPKIKELVRAKFNNFIKEINPDDQCSKLASEIKLFVKDDIAKILNDSNGLDVEVKPEVDHLSRECFHVSVENYKSPLFDLLIYPLDESLDKAIDAKAKEAEELMKTEKNLVNYLNTVIEGFDATGINDVEEVKTKLKAYIFSVLSDRYEGYLTVPFRQNAAEWYVNNYCDFTKAEAAEETSTATNENKK